MSECDAAGRVDEEDPIAAFAARRKRLAAIGLAGLLGLVVLYAAVMVAVGRSMSGPAKPLARLELTQTAADHTFRLDQAGRVVLWVEVEQRHTTALKSTTPTHAADVHIERDGETTRCETTEVRAFGELQRTGRTDRWRGQLSACDLGHLDAGTHTLTAHWSAVQGVDVDVERVTLIPAATN